MPKKTTTVPDPNAILINAERFLLAANHLTEALSRTGNPGLSTAFIVNGALALELYMKCIFVLDSKKPPLRTHDLVRIYDALCHEVRQHLNDSYRTVLNTNPAHRAMAIKIREMGIRNPQLEDPKIRTELEEVADAFVSWRYAWEGNLKGFAKFGELVRAMRATISYCDPSVKFEVPVFD